MNVWDALLTTLYRLGSICVLVAIGLLLNKMTQEKRHKDAKGSIKGNYYRVFTQALEPYKKPCIHFGLKRKLQKEIRDAFEREQQKQTPPQKVIPKLHSFHKETTRILWKERYAKAVSINIFAWVILLFLLLQSLATIGFVWNIPFLSVLGPISSTVSTSQFFPAFYQVQTYGIFLCNFLVFTGFLVAWFIPSSNEFVNWKSVLLTIALSNALFLFIFPDNQAYTLLPNQITLWIVTGFDALLFILSYTIHQQVETNLTEAIEEYLPE